MTNKRFHAAVEVMKAVYDTIKNAGPIPAGTLYSVLMAEGCTLSQYQSIEDTLVASGLVIKEGQFLSAA